MSSLVIVAIPEEQDRIWKISSQQVPHLTLLYLGGDSNQVQNLDQIMQFVEHAVTMSEHGPFYLDVERRGELGPDQADVLFFNKRSWNLKWIRQFRGQLLQNQSVRTAFDATAQHLEAPQEWLPHLTLGYPDTPAKPIPNDGFDHPIYSVCFDRIAVWAEDFNGPEFQLEWPERELDGDLAIAYSETAKAGLAHYIMNGTEDKMSGATVADRGEKFVEHFGVKGMKWGQRKEDFSNARGETHKALFGGGLALLSPSFRKNVPGPTKTKVALFGGYALLSPKVRNDLREASKKTAVNKADNAWEKGLRDGSAWVAVNNKSADHFNAHIGALNKKHPDDFTKDTKNFDDPSTYGPKYKSYMKDVDKLSRDSISHAANELHLKNPSGTKEVEIVSNGMPGDFALVPRRVQHAAGDQKLTFKINYVIDDNGRVTGFTFPENEEDVNAVHNTELESTLSHGAAFVDGLVNGSTESVGEQFLIEHFGIKGMRWGIRKEPPKAVSPTAKSVVPHGSRRKTKIERNGGENHPATEDAIKVEKARAKLKKSGPKALTNNELRDVAERLRLEEQAVQADRSTSHKWVRRFLGTQGNQAANQVVRSEVDAVIRGRKNK
jgi:hypothetical protein